MASLPPANTDIATRQDVERVQGDLERAEAGLRRDLERVETGLHRELENHTEAIRKDLEHQAVTFGANLQASEHRQQAYVWKVVVGTGVVLFVATVAALATFTGVIQQMIERA